MLRLSLQISILLAVCLTALDASGQSKVNKILAAKHIVGELYPEMKGQKLRVVVIDENSFDDPGALVRFQLRLYKPARFASNTTDNCTVFLQPAAAKCPALLLSLIFGFDANDKFYEFSARGDAVNADRLQALRQLVNFHPEWPDEKLVDAMKKAEVHFGPWAKDELVRSIPKSVLSSIIGDFQVSSIYFTNRDEQQRAAHLSSAVLLWNVRLIAHTESGKEIKYLALFEPFLGKLVSLSRLDLLKGE